MGKRISCTVNPSVEDDTIAPAETKKKVLVIGGGPAGMEAAYVAKNVDTKLFFVKNRMNLVDN